ncbi:iron chaperone [Alteromonas gracilis]|uniref:iron chaperone n=1 Tax=Alteromonas gracilis TaxID=1479524 RepID=UPI0030CBE39D
MVLNSYLEALPKARRIKLQRLADLIISLYPSAEVSMKYKMPTFSIDAGWVAIANQKNYVSLYTCSAQHLEQFKQCYPTIKTGTGCINFKDKDDLPIDALKQVITSAMDFGH